MEIPVSHTGQFVTKGPDHGLVAVEWFTGTAFTDRFDQAGDFVLLTVIAADMPVDPDDVAIHRNARVYNCG